MGRKSILKKGAMTDAERQRRRRRKLRREKRAALLEETRAANVAKHQASARCSQSPEQHADHLAREIVHHALYWQPPLPGPVRAADELVRQIAEWMAQERLTVADVRDALDRRFGPAWADAKEAA